MVSFSKPTSECSYDELIILRAQIDEQLFLLGKGKYNSGKIYRIVQIDKFVVIYVGSTKDSIDFRFGGHKSFIKSCADSKLSQYILSNGGPDNFRIELIMLYPCRSKKELENKEGYFVRLMKPLCNTVIPGSHAPVPPRQKAITTAKAQWLVSTDFISPDEFQKLTYRIKTAVTSTEDKRKHCKHVYMHGWGIDSIDAAFIKEMGTNVSDPKVKACMKHVFDNPCLQDHENIDEQRFFVQQTLIQQILDKLGFEHPFAVNHQIATDQVRDDVLSTQMFREYDRLIKLFNPRAEKHTDPWTQKKFTDALNIILGVIGLGVHSTELPNRTRVNGKRAPRQYIYKIDPKLARRTASLINLRVRFEIEAIDPGVQRYLEEVGYGDYEKYVIQEGEPVVNFIEESDDE